MPGTLTVEAEAGILRPVVVKIADALSDRPLAEAESVIEAARRILWMQRFTGVPAESVMLTLNAPSDARYFAYEIRRACASAADPLLATERILWELRMQLYSAEYGRRLGSHMLTMPD